MKKLCTGCLYIGYEDRTSHGSVKTESALWTVAFVLAFAGVFEKDLWLPATIVFAVAFFYTLTLFRIKICVCPRCGRDAMIPLNTPKADEIIGENHLPLPREFADPARTFWGFTLRDVLLILTSILVAIILYKEFANHSFLTFPCPFEANGSRAEVCHFESLLEVTKKFCSPIRFQPQHDFSKSVRRIRV